MATITQCDDERHAGLGIFVGARDDGCLGLGYDELVTGGEPGAGLELPPSLALDVVFHTPPTPRRRNRRRDGFSVHAHTMSSTSASPLLSGPP